MKIKQLKEILENYDDENEIVITDRDNLYMDFTIPATEVDGKLILELPIFINDFTTNEEEHKQMNYTFVNNVIENF